MDKKTALFVPPSDFERHIKEGGHNKSLQQKELRECQLIESKPVMPVASSPRYLVIGKR